MNKLYFWSDKYGGLVFPPSSFCTELNSDDFGDLPMVSMSSDRNRVDINISISNNISYVNNGTWTAKFLDNITTQKAESLVKMTNFFKLFVDFAIYDEKKNIIEEGVKIHPIDDIKDAIRIFSVDDNNQCNYIREKYVKTQIDLYGPGEPCPSNLRQIGSILTKPSIKYIRIRRIMIGVNMVPESGPKGIYHLNKTIIDKTIHPISPTTDDIKNQFIMIYDSAGSSFNPINVGDNARTVSLSIKVSIAGFFEVTKTTEKLINDIIYRNVHGEDPDEPDNPVNPPEPGTSGEYFSQFERCDRDNPKAGLVISDIDYEEGNYEGLCYPYSKVIQDISDIEIGEYVEYVESLAILSL